jgi:hypothetical protein
MTSTAVGKTGAPSGSTGKTEGRIIGVERTRLQWVRTDAIDPFETWLLPAEKHASGKAGGDCAIG